MLIFRGFLPLQGESYFEYAPWALLCGGLSSVAIIQGVVFRKVDRYFQRVMAGQHRAGHLLVSRRENAIWNDRIREYCKRNGIVIATEDEADRVDNDDVVSDA